MSSGLKQLGLAVTVGTATTLVLFWLAFSLSDSHEALAHIFYWQGWWLQTFIPCLNIGTSAKALCEGTPLNLVAFFAGIPFGVALYSAVAYGILSLLWQRAAQPSTGADAGK